MHWKIYSPILNFVHNMHKKEHILSKNLQKIDILLNNPFIVYINPIEKWLREGGWLITLKYLISPTYWKAKRLLDYNDPLDRAIIESIKHDDLMVNFVSL